MVPAQSPSASLTPSRCLSGWTGAAWRGLLLSGEIATAPRRGKRKGSLHGRARGLAMTERQGHAQRWGRAGATPFGAPEGVRTLVVQRHVQMRTPLRPFGRAQGESPPRGCEALSPAGPWYCPASPLRSLPSYGHPKGCRPARPSAHPKGWGRARQSGSPSRDRDAVPSGVPLLGAKCDEDATPGRAVREGRLMHERNPRVCSDCVTSVSKPENSWLRAPLGYYPAPRPAFYNVGSQAQDCI